MRRRKGRRFEQVPARLLSYDPERGQSGREWRDEVWAFAKPGSLVFNPLDALWIIRVARFEFPESFRDPVEPVEEAGDELSLED